MKIKGMYIATKTGIYVEVNLRTLEKLLADLKATKLALMHEFSVDFDKDRKKIQKQIDKDRQKIQKQVEKDRQKIQKQINEYRLRLDLPPDFDI